MGYFVGLPSEIDVVEGLVDRLTDSNGYDRDELDTVSSNDLDVDIEVYAEENDDVEVLERGNENGQTYLVLEPKTDDARALLSGETPPALEAGKPDGSNHKGGDNTMTDDYELEELDGADVRQAGSVLHHGDEDQYDEDNLDLEALGVANYIEEVATGQQDSLEMDDVAEYIFENDVDEQAVVDYKIGMADDYQEFKDTMEGFMGVRTDLIEELGAVGTTYQALHGEAAEERDNAEEAMQEVASIASDAPTSSNWLDNVADLNGAAQQERESAERKEDLSDTLQDIRDDL